MGKYYPEAWKILFDEKEQALVDNDCGDALSIASFEELQTSLHAMAHTYGNTGFPDIVSRLQPGFRYLDSFEKAITSASQYDPRACLVWGIIQAFTRSACQSQAAVADMLELINELNEALPEFDEYLKMVPQSPALQSHLQNIYNVYMDYCIASIRYMNRSPSLSFITYFFASDPTASLKRAKEEINRHMRLFERAAKISVHKQILMGSIEKELQDPPLDTLSVGVTRAHGQRVEFPINTVTLYRNFMFKGREQELQDVRSALSPRNVSDRDVLPPAGLSGIDTLPPSTQSKYGHGPSCCILHGLGGIGKTQTALEFVHSHKQNYDAIFWVSAQMEATIGAAYAAMAKLLGLIGQVGSGDEDNQGQAIERTKKWLQSTARKWLIVFDNVEDINDLTLYFPQSISSASGIIITTQKNDFVQITEHFTTISLKDLTREQGSELIFACLKRQPRNEDEEEYTRKISDLLGGLPLALSTIGGYMRTTGSSVRSFYEDLKTTSYAWESSSLAVTGQYERTLRKVFQLALKELPEHARYLINILAFLNPDQIPEELFTSKIGDTRYPFISSKAKFSDTIGSLRTRQLVGRDTSGSMQYLTIHRSVQYAVLYDLTQHSKEARRQAYDHAFDLIRSAMPKVSSIDNPEPGFWTEFQKWVPHILTLRAHCLWPEPPMVLSLDFAQVLSDMATFMWQAGLFQEGMDAMKTADEILDAHNIGIEHPLRGNIHEHIAIIASYYGVSYRDESMSRRYQAIEAREASHKLIEQQGKVTREDEIRLWNVQSDLAFGLLQLEEFAEAGRVIERCHEQYLKWGNVDEIPFEYVKYNMVISYTYMAEGKVLEAVRACKEGTRIAELSLGPKNGVTLNLRTCLANHLYFAGMIDECLQENLLILQARIDVMGEGNHKTLEVHSMCGSLYAMQGNLEQAEYHFITCLDPAKRTLWDDEGIARARFLYSDVLRRLGKIAEADALLKQARIVRDEFLAKYPQWLTEDKDDELVVFDQMVCLWAGRYTGKLKQRKDEDATAPAELLVQPKDVTQVGELDDDEELLNNLSIA